MKWAFRSRGYRLAGVFVLPCVCLSLGQGCPPPPPPPPETACGEFAAECVTLADPGPLALAAGDFDHDGDRDLVVGYAGREFVTVLLNNGNGTFEIGLNYSVGGWAGSIASGDFDGDEHVDLAVAHLQGVTLLWGQGNGTFTPVNLPAGGGARGVVAADLDGDGDLDLAVTTVAPDQVLILRNNSQRAFGGGQTVDFDRFVQGIAAGDLDGDSRTDLVVGYWLTGTVSILMNTESGVFASPVALDIGPNHVLEDVFVADLDGDQAPDIVVADNGDTGNASDVGAVIVFFNTGTGEFGAPVRLPTGKFPEAIFAADFDGDGDLDLVAANSGADTFSLLFNQGDRVFAAPRDYRTGKAPSYLAVADFNGDGHADLTISNTDSGTVGVYLNDGHGAFVRAP